MSIKSKDKFRPYLSMDELKLVLTLLNVHRDRLGLSPQETEITNSCRKVIFKTYINADTGSNPAYTGSSNPNVKISDQLGLSEEELIISKELTDQEKLDSMSEPEKLEYWIKFNIKEFGIEASEEQLNELKQMKESNHG